MAFKNRLHDTRNFRPVKHDHLFCSKIRTVSGISGSFSGSGKSTFSEQVRRSFAREKEHIDWADQYGVLDEVDKYLRSLPESQWAHIREQ